MPYDPRHVDDGGNRTTRINELKASKGKYKVISVDTFDGGDVVLGQFKTEKAAVAEAKKHSGQMLIAYVYNDQGKMVFKSGSF